MHFPVSSEHQRIPMKKTDLLYAIQREIKKHDLDYFVEGPPTIAQGGRGVVTPGCPTCKKRFQTISQFADHIAFDVLPPLLDQLRTEANKD